MTKIMIKYKSLTEHYHHKKWFQFWKPKMWTTYIWEYKESPIELENCKETAWFNMHGDRFIILGMYVLDE